MSILAEIEVKSPPTRVIGLEIFNLRILKIMIIYASLEKYLHICKSSIEEKNFEICQSNFI